MSEQSDRATGRMAIRPGEDPAPVAAAREVLALVLIGSLLLLPCLVVIALSGMNPTVIFAVYALMMTAGPLVAGGTLYLWTGGGRPFRDAFPAGLERIESFLVCLVVALIAVVAIMPAAGDRTGLLWTVAIAAFALFAGALWFHRARAVNSADRRADWLAGLLVVALATAVFMLSPFTPSDQIPVGYVAYAADSPGFGWWAVAGVAWVAFGIWLRRVEPTLALKTSTWLVRIAVAVTVLFIFSLYDDGHYIHIMSYEPLVDAAMNVVHGGAPMVDAYSQYGLLPWAIYALAFKVLPATFGSAAVVLRLINLAYFLVVMAMVLSICRWRLSALWFLAPALVATLVSHDPFPRQMWNVYAFPMLLGGRWLVPSLMALTLVMARGRARAGLLSLLLIALAALASMEILAFTLAPWGFCALLEAIRRRSIGQLLAKALAACLAVAAAHLALAGGVFLLTGKVVDYAPYLSILRDYRPVEGNGWSMTFDPLMALWFPVALSYFTILAVACWRAFRGEDATSAIEQLVPVAMFGLGPLAYFFGRPQEPGLTLSCPPFAVVVISLSQVLFRNPARFGIPGRALAGVFAFGFAFVVATTFEHFWRPYSPTEANATILRRCFTPQGCQDALRNIGIALSSKSLDTRTWVGQGLNAPSEFDTKQRIEELGDMLQRLSPDTRDVAMVTDFWDPAGGNAHAISVAAAMDTGHWRTWFFTAPFHDGQASVVADRVLKRVLETPPGTLVIVSNRREGLVPLNRQILDLLDARCSLSMVEADKYHTAYRLNGCK